ncbi:MAG: hypothetical protein JXB32_23145 [Deltaproteobacteria bacterium]|nr:hypothetical protein [Deltaproteobacteria bacterium]
MTHQQPSPRALVVLWGVALLLPAVPAAADPAREAPPILVGPVVAGDAAPVFAAAHYRVDFDTDGPYSDVQLTLQVQAADELRLGFAARDCHGLAASLDGGPTRPEYSSTPLPASGGPFDTQLVVVVPPGDPHTVVVQAHCETWQERRDPRLDYPQATFLFNRLLDGPDARVVHLEPAAARDAADLRLRVETAADAQPEAPVVGTPAESADGRVLEGTVTLEPLEPLEAAAAVGEYAVPRNWSFGLAIGLALDWPLVERTVVDTASGQVVERWYATPGTKDITPRMWLRALFHYGWERWMLVTGLEGDPLGALEVPLTFVWFPQERPTGWGHPIGDWHLLFGLAFQVFNDWSPNDHAFDPRLFLRAGFGFRFHALAAEFAYELAPPMGDWNGPHGLLEHKVLITFPLAF